MFLNNIFADPESTARLIDIAKSSLQPLLEGAILYTIPLTIHFFYLWIILAVLTALARISSCKISSNHCKNLCFCNTWNTVTRTIIYYILWIANCWNYY